MRELEAVANLLRSSDIDAIEIHTGAGYAFLCLTMICASQICWFLLQHRALALLF